MIASTAPVPPKRCPVMDLDEVSEILYACSPNTSFMADLIYDEIFIVNSSLMHFVKRFLYSTFEEFKPEKKFAILRKISLQVKSELPSISLSIGGNNSSVANRVAVFDGTSGKQIKDSGFTLGKSVPADALFTDTTYKAATASSEGLMSANDFTKLAGIEAAADKTDTANVSAAGAFMLATNTADNVKDGSSKVVMTASERTKLSGVAAGAEVNQNSFSTVKVGSTNMASTGKTDTFEIAAGDGITLTPGTKKVTITETYVDSCVVNSLDNIPANLRNGGLIILKQ